MTSSSTSAVYEAELVVGSREFAADGVLALTLRHPLGEELPAWEPGAHIDVLLGPELERQYSLCGDPADRAVWRIGVLREPDGRGGSAYVHDGVGGGRQGAGARAAQPLRPGAGAPLPVRRRRHRHHPDPADAGRGRGGGRRVDAAVRRAQP